MISARTRVGAIIGLGAALTGSSAHAADGSTRPLSRAWMALAEQAVGAARPAPADAARIYAYTAVAYQRGLDVTGDAEQASEVTRRVLVAVVPTEERMIDRRAPARLPATTPLAASATTIVEELLARVAGDGRAGDNPERAWRTAPRGPGYWVRTAPKTPLTPSAGVWQRWIVTGQRFPVPAPPRHGTAALRRELAGVRRATAARDARWLALIRYWAGGPGTQTPAGIWQDRLWVETRATPLGRDDRAYATTQAVLAMTIADAFMESWKVKYRWWTARPSMLDGTLRLAIKNPPFPSYPSGHSTISSAAAEVLSAMVPARTAVWRRDARRARDTRLYAGIHFPVDNAAGFALGRAVGKTAIARLSLGAVPVYGSLESGR